METWSQFFSWVRRQAVRWIAFCNLMLCKIKLKQSEVLCVDKKKKPPKRNTHELLIVMKLGSVGVGLEGQEGSF